MLAWLLFSRILAWPVLGWKAPSSGVGQDMMMMREGQWKLCQARAGGVEIILPGVQDAGLTSREREGSFQRCGPGCGHKKREVVRVMLGWHR